MLAATANSSADDCAALQRDVVGYYAPPLRDALVQAIGGIAGNPVAALALIHLRAWDGAFASDSCGALLYMLTLQDLLQRVFMPILGKDLGTRYVNGRRAMPRLHKLLLDPADPLRADVTRASRAEFDVMARDAFFAAVSRIAPQQGSDPARWRWGELQRIRLGTALSLIPGLGSPFIALEDAFPGDEYTVSPSRGIPMRGKLYAAVGATSRFICDLATPEEALFAHSAGPSADPLSPFFANLSRPWHRFEYFRSALWKADQVPEPVEHVKV